MDISMKRRKAEMEEGIMPKKSFWCGWRGGNIPNTISYRKLLLTTIKMKNNFCNGCQYKMQESRDGGGNNAHKIFTSRGGRGYIPNTVSYAELFMNTLKIKNNFCDGHQYEMQRSRDGGGNNVQKNLFEAGGGGKYSKHNILCETVTDYHENEK